MTQNFRVFVVDDDPLLIDLVSIVLSEDFDVEGFTSAKACLERMKTQIPDMLLLDVSMPEVDGHTFCTKLKANTVTQQIPITFISANDDFESRVACYEVGGSDFIQKPFEPEVLINKVRVAKQQLQEKYAMKRNAAIARTTAMSAINIMDELGLVVIFLSQSLTCKTPQALAEAILSSTSELGLDGAVQIRSGTEYSYSLSKNGIDVPLEVAVLNHVRNTGSIFNFKNRCVFNYGQISLLINNMPLEDADRCGRIRDNLAILVEGAEARWKSILLESKNAQRQIGIQGTLPKLHQALETVQNNYQHNNFQLTQVLVEYQEALFKSYGKLGLTSDQEEEIAQLSTRYMQRLIDYQDQSLSIVGELKSVTEDLENLAQS